MALKDIVSEKMINIERLQVLLELAEIAESEPPPKVTGTSYEQGYIAGYERMKEIISDKIKYATEEG